MSRPEAGAPKQAVVCRGSTPHSVHVKTSELVHHANGGMNTKIAKIQILNDAHVDMIAPLEHRFTKGLQKGILQTFCVFSFTL